MFAEQDFSRFTGGEIGTPHEYLVARAEATQ